MSTLKKSKNSYTKEIYSIIKRNPALSIEKNFNGTLKKMTRVYLQKGILSPSLL